MNFAKLWNGRNAAVLKDRAGNGYVKITPPEARSLKLAGHSTGRYTYRLFMTGQVVRMIYDSIGINEKKITPPKPVNETEAAQ